ncbi:MAG: sigma-70 family RNA polymerase sigma factor [Solirubrobacterales bacterium]|nr:sigma-70 family RNA polymerase sigma factor [Solirubrobacterales bacterium]
MTAAGSESAFEAIVHRYRRGLHAYCRRLLLSGNHTEDVVQQTFLSAWTSLQDGAEVRELKAWLYRIAHNHAITMLRRASFDCDELGESLQGAEGPELDLEQRTLTIDTLAAVAALPELQREAIVRTAIDGASYEEVAAALGVSDHAVRGLVYRARSSVRAALAGLAPQPLIIWAAGTTRRDGALSQWMSGMCAAGGSIGETAIVARGGRVVVTTAVVVGGAVGSVISASSPKNPLRNADVAPRTEPAPQPRGPGAQQTEPARVWAGTRAVPPTAAPTGPIYTRFAVRADPPRHPMRTEPSPILARFGVAAGPASRGRTAPPPGGDSSGPPTWKLSGDVERASAARAPVTSDQPQTQEQPQNQGQQAPKSTSQMRSGALVATDQPSSRPSGTSSISSPTRELTGPQLAGTQATSGGSDLPQGGAGAPPLPPVPPSADSPPANNSSDIPPREPLGSTDEPHRRDAAQGLAVAGRPT